jgi:hypothetical protein
MSDDLTALQEAAVQARAKADELKAVITDASSDEEKAAAVDAETVATSAESAYADAKAKADAAALDQSNGGAGGTSPDADASRTDFVSGARAGDECLCPDGRKGTVHKFDEGLVCIPNADQG